MEEAVMEIEGKSEGERRQRDSSMDMGKREIEGNKWEEGTARGSDGGTDE